MKTSTRMLLVILLVASTSVFPGNGVVGEELAVIQAMASAINQEAHWPYDYLYFESDFSAGKNIESSMENPDRTEFCGLTRPEAEVLMTELKHLSTDPIEFENEVARPAGLKVGHKKLPRFRYLFLSRVVFAPDNRRAWLAVDLNGESGAIMRLDKIDGQWSKAARCAGWMKAPE
jgi:hypothetical protein